MSTTVWTIATGRAGSGLTGVVLLAAVSVWSCGLFRAQEPPSEPPTISGMISAIQWEREQGDLAAPVPNVLIEENPAPGVGGKIFVGFHGASVFVRAKGGPWRRGTEADLLVGAHAQAWTTLVASSYPGMGRAREIAVTLP